MQRSSFIDPTTGQLIRTLQDQWAFVPASLPPALDRSAIAVKMGEAMMAVGELKGACRRLVNPSILIRPLQRQEALTSSAMEGTFTTADDLVLSEVDDGGSPDDSTREVRNYLRALDGAMQMLEKLPIGYRVLTTAHRMLLSGLSRARGAQKKPGEYKTDQNFIGGGSIANARFVPPPPAEAHRCMDARERYINRPPEAFPNPLTDLALAHYQIETIHPFADGNGRIGRMLVSLMAVQSGLLERPVLYISPALEDAKDEYVDLMFNVSTRGEWSSWLNFFFDKITETCRATIQTIDRLITLQDGYRQQASASMRSGSAANLVDLLFANPATTVTDAATRLDISYPTARKAIDKLVEIGVLQEIPHRYPKTFIARGILDAARPV